MMRLDKYLAEMGAGTRSEVKKAIRHGEVCVDGKVEKRPERKIEEDIQNVLFREKPICYKKMEYYMLNKPAGVISASSDRNESTVVDLIRTRQRKDLFPVGRLDRDTEGLLLLTNDGALSHRLLSPKKHVDKCYYAKIDGVVTVEDIQAFERGVDIGERDNTMPADLEILSSGFTSEICLTIREGKFHQVKRMFATIGKPVLYLKRLSMGPLTLDETLRPGEYRELTEKERIQICCTK